MTGLKVGDTISFKESIMCEDGTIIPKQYFEKGRTLEVIQIDKRRDGRYRVVIGNPCLNDGVVTKGVTGAIIINDKTIFK